jgi:hypothetical protein
VSSKAAFAAFAALVLAVAAAGSVCAQTPPLRDPMRPFEPGVAGAGAQAPRGYRLSAVLISTARRVAVVNGRPYQEGEMVDRATLIRIEPKVVHLRKDGEDLVVHLQGDSGS